MITATVLAIFWVPLFFATVSAAGERKKTVTTETPKEAGQ
jgi:multidrug efflux pump